MSAFAAPYGMPARPIDGNDLLAVYAAAGGPSQSRARRSGPLSSRVHDPSAWPATLWAMPNIPLAGRTGRREARSARSSVYNATFSARGDGERTHALGEDARQEVLEAVASTRVPIRGRIRARCSNSFIAPPRLQAIQGCCRELRHSSKSCAAHSMKSWRVTPRYTC